MIDIHVHLRDWEQSSKETILNSLENAYHAGLTAVFEMPNTSRALTSRKTIDDRIALADEAISTLSDRYSEFDMFHGIYTGLTADSSQIREVFDTYNDLDRVVGMKMFAGHSTGNMGLVDDSQSTGEEKQRIVYGTLADLGYKGVLAVHCEKEAFIMKDDNGKQFYDPEAPISHSAARPPISEIESVKDQIRFAQEEGFGGNLHICHISVPEALEYIEETRRGKPDFTITTEMTPHHLLLNSSALEKNGAFAKMNPPLRPKCMQEYMLGAFIDGRIDMIGTDHAPHTLADKQGDSPASGVPTIDYYSHFISIIKKIGASERLIEDMTYNTPMRVFNIPEGSIRQKAGISPGKNFKKKYDYSPFE